MAEVHYRRDLAEVHHLGVGFHPDTCAPGVFALLEPVHERKGLVLELGCGSGLLTRHLIDAGTWRRDDERHDNVLIDTSRIPALLAPNGVQGRITRSFGTDQLPEGLMALVGLRTA